MQGGNTHIRFQEPRERDGEERKETGLPRDQQCKIREKSSVCPHFFIKNACNSHNVTIFIHMSCSPKTNRHIMKGCVCVFPKICESCV